MALIHSTLPTRETPRWHITWRRLATTAIMTAAALLLAGCIAGPVALRLGLAPAFDWQLNLDERRFLLVHNGVNGPSCAGMGVAPLADCAWRVPGRREFYIRYFSREGDPFVVDVIQTGW